MEITIAFIGLFFLGCGLGYPVLVIAANRGPIPWLLVPMIAYSIPLFTIGPHPIVLGLYCPISVYLLYSCLVLIRNPSEFNQLFLRIGQE